MELSFVELFRGGSSRTRTGFAGEGEINKTKVQNVKQHQCLAVYTCPDTYTGLYSHSEAEVSMRFHHYPVGVRLGTKT